MNGNEPPRVITLWVPDWPVVAAARTADLPQSAPLALIRKGVVMACSAAARVDGVQRGLRVREAQSRCPHLEVIDHDPSMDARLFEPVIAGIEDLAPGVQVVRPGICAVLARGPARYYGSEDAAAAAILDRMDKDGAPRPRAGIADGLFTAVEAARRTGAASIRVIPRGESGGFLSPLPVDLLEDDGLATLLRRLGIRTLGEFAELPPADVETRFGPAGARLQTLAAGRDGTAQVGRTPPPELDLVAGFEPPLEGIEEIAFSVRAAAERFIDGITEHGLACTGIVVEFGFDDGRTSQRTWLHPRSFKASEVVDRVRWQLEGQAAIPDAMLGGDASGDGRRPGAGVVRVRISPASADPLGAHDPGLWGGSGDDRVHHALSRVQSILGHDAVLMPVLSGGRTLSQRQRTVPWGDRPAVTVPTDRPWPGSLPDPLPGTVFTVRHALEVTDPGGAPVTVDSRGALSGGPASVRSAQGDTRRLIAWAGPWPLDERWWERESADGEPRGPSMRPAGPAHRVQVLDDTGCGWLLVLDADGWWTEARYD